MALSDFLSLASARHCIRHSDRSTFEERASLATISSRCALQRRHTNNDCGFARGHLYSGKLRHFTLRERKQRSRDRTAGSDGRFSGRFVVMCGMGRGSPRNQLAFPSESWHRRAQGRMNTAMFNSGKRGKTHSGDLLQIL